MARERRRGWDGVPEGPRGALGAELSDCGEGPGSGGSQVSAGTVGALAAVGGHPCWTLRGAGQRAQPCVAPLAKPELLPVPGVIDPSLFQHLY